ncbi:MAG TPA: hypothetical protein VG938_16535 [Verrucomicrobiae bacterium]|jgi:hypothetical protein|nr:hypothetical protein [Verrucomicrobiae bacterium]
MNDKKLNQLLNTARRETPAAPTEGFEMLVMRQIQRDPARVELSISDLLGQWFPRLAVAAAAIIAVCVLGDFMSSGPSLTDSAAQLSAQYFAEN